MSQYNSRQLHNHQSQQRRRQRSQADESDNWRVRRPLLNTDSNSTINRSISSSSSSSITDRPIASIGQRLHHHHSYLNRDQGNGIFGSSSTFYFYNNGTTPPPQQFLDPPRPPSPPKRGSPMFMGPELLRVEVPFHEQRQLRQQSHGSTPLSLQHQTVPSVTHKASTKTSLENHTEGNESDTIATQPYSTTTTTTTAAAGGGGGSGAVAQLPKDSEESSRAVNQYPNKINAAESDSSAGYTTQRTTRHREEKPQRDVREVHYDKALLDRQPSSALSAASSEAPESPLKRWAEYAETLQAEEAEKEKYWQDRKAALKRAQNTNSNSTPVTLSSSSTTTTIATTTTTTTATTTTTTTPIPAPMTHQTTSPRQRGDQIRNDSGFHNERYSPRSNRSFNHNNRRNNRYNNNSRQDDWHRPSQKEREETFCHPDDRNGGGRREQFPRYLHPDVIERGLRDGTYVLGVLRLNRNPMDAYVTSENLDHDIFIHGFRDRNRALDGDMVAIELLDNVDEIWAERQAREQERQKLRKKMKQQEAAEKKKKAVEKREEKEEVKEDEDDVSVVLTPNEETEASDDSDQDDDDDEDESRKPKYCGRVVAIIERSPNTKYSGTILLEKPNRKRLNEIGNIEKGTGEASANDNDDSATQGETDLSTPTTTSTPISTTESSNNGATTSAAPTPTRQLRYAWFKPTDKRIPFFVLKHSDVPQELVDNEEYFSSHLFEVELRRWQITDRQPTGRLVKEIGPIGTLVSEKMALLTDSNVITSGFSELALKCLPEVPWTVPSEEYNVRRDLRDERVFSIDPKTAKDLDDALHIKELPDGFFEVGVHIADVSYFVKKGTVLDSEARNRGTSTYLVDDVVPMLPSLLCEELCSLNPGVERLAFSVIWKMNKRGKSVETWFGKTIIKSCAKLAYEDAQAVIDGGEFGPHVTIYGNHDVHDIYNDIRILQRLAVEMRKRRFEGGSLSMQSVKLQFELDDCGEPVSVSQFHAKEANKMIEEFMLCANISVAHKITEIFPDEALLRRHQQPIERRLDQFLKIADVLGLEFDGSTAGSLQTSFDKITNKDVRDVMLVLAIRTMQKAKYFCAGSVAAEKYRHYALNEPIYTHFTSPIRRYADVIVHRMLSTAIKLKYPGNAPYAKKNVIKTAFHCNSKKEGARSAQDRSISLYLAHLLKKREETEGPILTKAVVIVVAKRHYEVYVPEYGLEKKVTLEALPLNDSQFDKDTLALDLFWQHNVPVTMHNEEKIYGSSAPNEGDLLDSSSDEEDENDDKDKENKEEGDDEVEIQTSLQALMLKEATHDRIANHDDLIPPIVLDEETGRQQLKMFSSIEVRIQVNDTLSPPIINIYPVNPFCDEKPEEEEEE